MMYLSLFVNFVSNLYIPQFLRNIFKIMVFRLLENVFCKSKNCMQNFLLMSTKTKISLRFLSSPPQAEGNYSFPLPKQRFSKICFLHQKKKERRGNYEGSVKLIIGFVIGSIIGFVIGSINRFDFCSLHNYQTHF